MRRVSLLVSLALLAAACSTATPEPITPTSTTSTGAPSSSTTDGPGTTTTSGTEATTTTQAATSGGAQFVISSVSFGTGRMVVITNIGDETGNLAGHFLCQRPAYWAFPDLEVPVGQSVAVSAGGSVFLPPPGALVIDESAGIGQLVASDGEVALYDSNSFGSSDSILSYVEWGSSGHPRSSVAVNAGIWPAGGFVETTSATVTIIANTVPATEPAHWDPF